MTSFPQSYIPKVRTFTSLSDLSDFVVWLRSVRYTLNDIEWDIVKQRPDLHSLVGLQLDRAANELLKLQSLINQINSSTSYGKHTEKKEDVRTGF